MKKIMITQLLMIALTLSAAPQCQKTNDGQSSSGTSDIKASAYGSSSWTAEYADGQKIDNSGRYPSKRNGKTVGIFYFVWHGSHGYDGGSAGSSYTSESVKPSSANVNSPYDINELMKVDKEKGFNYVVNNKVTSDRTTTLQTNAGGWRWNEGKSLDYRVSGCEMELAVPLGDLGIKNVRDFTISFKWIDNAAVDGDILTCMKDGDSAPNSRFRYVFHHKR